MTGSADKARSYALLLLRYRGRSKKELCDRLKKKGFAREEIEETLAFLARAGFINDRDLAENLKRQAMTNKLLGFEGARQFMRQRGLSKEIIDETLEYDEETELQNIRKLLEKKEKSIGKFPEPKRSRSLIGMLMRKGYPMAVIIKAVKISQFREEIEV